MTLPLKNYNLTLFFLFVLLPVVGLSQNSRIDSLRYKLKFAQEDTNKIKLLDTLSSQLAVIDLKQGFGYAKQLLALSQKLNYKPDIIIAYQDIAGYYYYMGDMKTARAFLDKDIQLLKNTRNKIVLYKIYSNLANFASMQSNYSEAFEFSNKALQLAEDMKDSLSIAKELKDIGIIYSYMSDYPTALSCFFRSMKINLSINDNRLLANDYYSLGVTYGFQNNVAKSTEYLNLAYNLATKINDKFLIPKVLTDQGEICAYNKQWKKAEDYFQQSISMTQDSVAISNNIRNIASVYSEQGQCTKALQAALTALNISQRVGLVINIGNSYEVIGEIYMKMKNYSVAINYFQKALDIATSNGQKTNQGNIYGSLQESYEALNNYKTADFYGKQLSAIKDSILNKETVEKTVEVEALYNSEKSEQEIVLLTKNEEIHKLQIKKQSLLQKSLIGGIILLSIMFFFIYRNYHTHQLLKLQALRNKIASDLHDDIGATLSSISMFTLMAREGSKEVIPMLDQIGDYSRKILESMADIVWSINPENDNFEKIILRMRSFAYELLRVKSIDFEFNTDEALDKLKLSMDQRKNFYLIFKEATNNMVKYSHANRAIFSITHSKNIFTLLIRDNGKGFNPNEELIGNGLKNMKKRALEMGAKLLIESEPGSGTTIQLLLKTS